MRHPTDGNAIAADAHYDQTDEIGNEDVRDTLRTLAARIAELEAQEKKSRGYRVGHIAGFNAGIRQAAKLYREGRDWDVFATADCAILSLIDKEPTP